MSTFGDKEENTNCEVDNDFGIGYKILNKLRRNEIFLLA
jgi:hypothetical protein